LKKLLLLLLVVAAAVLGWGVLRKSEPPKLNFAHVKRQTLVSSLPTNGKVEPFEWQSARAEIAGLSRVDVREGQTVAKGALLASLTDPSLEAEIQAGEAKVAEAAANVAALEAGGRPSEFTDIDNSLIRARLDLQEATKEYESLRRLAEKQAATPVDVQAAQLKVQQAQLAIDGLLKRRTSLVAMPDLTAAKARQRDMQSSLDFARQRAGQSVVRAPIAGVVYGLAVQTGAYLNVGDLVANVGRMDRLRVRVYVDEPELGRIAEGQPVTLTWQALPGKKWLGTVQRKPTSIQALGSRQVGEVVCIIENPDRELVPGTNVDAEIRTAVVDNALVIPRETLRHDASGDYVFALKGDIVERRPVKTGASSISQVQVVEGLSESDAVALPSDNPIKPGERVTAAM
jgi:HlyD family secretion protein